MPSRTSARRLALGLALSALAACGGGGGGEGDGGRPEDGPPPAVVSVAVEPAVAPVAVGASRTFEATVSGAPSGAVTWAVEPAGCGAVASTSARTATFTAPAAPTTCEVRATSVAAPARSGLAAAVVTPASSGGVCGADPGQLFPRDAAWNTPVDGWALDAASTTITSYLAQNHLALARFRITFDFNLLYVGGATARRSFARTGDFYSPDCDPAPLPVPPGGRLEGETSYACAGDGDCHLTVVDVGSCRLWEMWRAHIPGGRFDGAGFAGGCLAIWALDATPPATGRGDFCTSADAAGLPVLPLVFTADEVAAGSIEHAIRFVLPNALIRRLVFVRPGTHSTTATAGPAAAPPYAARLRLKASKDLSGLGAAAQVVARALKRYGMILADGGNVTFTAATDALTVHKWAEVGLGAGDLASLSWSDFEVVELGPRYTWNGDCVRTPIAQ